MSRSSGEARRAASARAVWRAASLLVARPPLRVVGMASGAPGPPSSGAYAKLEGEDGDGTRLVRYVCHLDVFLGRRPKKDLGDSNHVDLGDSKLLSRKHARLTFDPAAVSWRITALSKNGFMCDNAEVCAGESVLLSNGKASALRIGGVSVYFAVAAP